MPSLIRGLLAVLASVALPALALAGPVNINEANAETLARELDGIGPALAAAIVRDREENGPYESPEEITRVRGVGERVLENNRDNIRIEDEKPADR